MLADQADFQESAILAQSQKSDRNFFLNEKYKLCTVIKNVCLYFSETV